MNIVDSQLCRTLYFVNTSWISFSFAEIKDNSIQDSNGKSAYALTDLKLRTACYMYVYMTLVHCHKSSRYLEGWAEQNGSSFNIEILSYQYAFK